MGLERRAADLLTHLLLATLFEELILAERVAAVL